VKSTVARGYGSAHRRMREAAKVSVDAGQAACSRCGGMIVPGTPWDLDHTPDRLGWLGPAHRRCNRAAGARVANARRGGRRRPRVLGATASRAW
jgi:hypothetical protein